MALYTAVPLFDTGPRRKRLFGHNVATDYWAGIVWIILIPSLALTFIFTVVLSADMLMLFSYRTLLLSTLIILILTAVVVVALVALLVADPGVVRPGTAPALSHRCPICNWDVDEFDHHCPIVGACIGLGTMRYFITFTGAAFLLCLVIFILTFSLCMRVGVSAGVFSLLWRSPNSFFALFVKTFAASRARLLCVAFAVIAVYGGLFCSLLAAAHIWFSLTGRFSVERRRKAHANPGIRYVFANYFHPQSARRAYQLLSVGPV